MLTVKKFQCKDIKVKIPHINMHISSSYRQPSIWSTYTCDTEPGVTESNYWPEKNKIIFSYHNSRAYMIVNYKWNFFFYGGNLSLYTLPDDFIDCVS